MQSSRTPTPSCRSWLVAWSCLGLLACAREAREPQPLGALPSAVTTAEPLFLPFAIRAGKAVAADPRERHLADLRRLTFDGRALHAVWSPDGRSLLVESAGAGDACSSVAELDLEHGELRRVSPDGAPAHGPAFDRDGHALFAVASAGADCRGDVARSLAFEAPRASTGIRSADAAAPALGSLGADPSELARSPDGRAFAFTSTRDGNPELYLFAIGDGEPRRLTDRPGYDGMAAFSPDGTRLAWQGAAAAPEAAERPSSARGTPPTTAGTRTRTLGIFVAGSAGQHPVAVVAAVGLNVGPAFFPDSRRLVFASDREAVGATTGAARDFELFAVDPDGPATATGGPALERVTYAAGFDGWARFSPDGKYLVFTSSRDAGRGSAPAGPGDTDVYVARWVD
ncbi:MAG: PD40 domain-containing protein [Polyangiaceae bacterium]|nr:PD40 domain-containing protein [Polyangiaceae bacterium]